MNFWFGRWSVIFMVGAGGGRCFAFFLVGGRLLLSRMVVVCVLISIWSVAHGRWLMDGGLWSMAGRWAVVLYYAHLGSLRSPCIRLQFETLPVFGSFCDFPVSEGSIESR